MDHIWERSIPFCSIGMEEAKEVFQQFDKSLEISELTPILLGCRNSNFRVKTEQQEFLLRVCPIGDESYKKDESIWKDLYKQFHVPQILYISEKNSTDRVCLIYEFVEGRTLQEVALQRGSMDDYAIVQAAEIAAIIHNYEPVEKSLFQSQYPPFSTWYDLFLNNEYVGKRLGGDTMEKVKRLIKDKKEDLEEIDRYQSFIHADFRPANMIVDKYDALWIIDWEFAGYGHSLADIGQFFRYESYFEPIHLMQFEIVYNKYSKRPLPKNWYQLSKLRDLVNPLQLLGAEEDYPQKYDDLKNLVQETLNFFKY
jgi:thiamine kinase-like enzyme